MKKETLVKIGFGIPVLVGVYLIFSQFMKKSYPADAPPPQNPQKDSQPEASAANKDFPLKKGSKNDTVKSLQALLKSTGATIDVDGKFGNQTEGVLKTVYGKSQVDSLSDFRALENMLKSKSLLSSNLSWAWKLIEAFKTRNTASLKFSTNLLAKKDLVLYGADKNFQGLWLKNGKKLNMPKGKYVIADYEPQSALTDGSLRIYVNKGNFKGYWLTDKNIDLASNLDLI